MKTDICIAGDSILMYPFPENYTGVDAVRRFIHQGDVRINNLEMVLSDYDCFASTFCGGVWLTASPEILDEIVKFGFNCFGFANNHTMDYSYDGLTSTLDEVKGRGLPICGAGMSLAEATEPAYVQTPNGTAAVFSITSTCDDAARAGDPGHKIPARPGLNMLRHSETFLVNREHMNALEEIARVTHVNGRINNSKRGGYTVSKPGIFSLGNLDFKLSEIEGKTSAPNPFDMDRMEAAVRKAKEKADCIIVCVHSHEIKGDFDEEPDYFLETFAHACIDWGVSAVIGSGTHEIKGVEIYRGKPIFYSIANFIFHSEKMQELPADYYERYRIDPSLSAAEAVAVRSDHGKRGLETEPKYYRGLLPKITFEDGELQAITIQPIELGFLSGDPMLKGLPNTADEQVTADICEVLRVRSREYGTEFTIKNGLIHVKL